MSYGQDQDGIGAIISGAERGYHRGQQSVQIFKALGLPYLFRLLIKIHFQIMAAPHAFAFRFAIPFRDFAYGYIVWFMVATMLLAGGLGGWLMAIPMLTVGFANLIVASKQKQRGESMYLGIPLLGNLYMKHVGAKSPAAKLFWYTLGNELLSIPILILLAIVNGFLSLPTIDQSADSAQNPFLVLIGALVSFPLIAMPFQVLRIGFIYQGHQRLVNKAVRQQDRAADEQAVQEWANETISGRPGNAQSRRSNRDNYAVGTVNMMSRWTQDAQNQQQRLANLEQRLQYEAEQRRAEAARGT